jgi:hypothetical protein
MSAAREHERMNIPDCQAKRLGLCGSQDSVGPVSRAASRAALGLKRASEE